MIKSLATGTLAALLALSLVACDKKPATPTAQPAGVSVTAVTLGKAIGADKRVTAPVDSFSRSDTIFAAVETSGSGNATIRARWAFHKNDKSVTVDEDTQNLVATGPAVTEFHVSKPDGWPVGEYQIEIFLNGASTGSKVFTVK